MGGAVSSYETHHLPSAHREGTWTERSLEIWSDSCFQSAAVLLKKSLYWFVAEDVKSWHDDAEVHIYKWRKCNATIPGELQPIIGDCSV